MGFVELRVHGVHGTSPGAMLGVSDSDVAQVAGDQLTGIYRSRAGVLPGRDLESMREHDVSVEAYSWGSLTSGVQGFFGWVKRALWLLLLPFALANLAYWARLQLGEATGTARWGARAVRLSGLLLTVFMVLTPCVVAIDVVGWQCYRYEVPGCTRIPSQLDSLASLTPGQRIALVSLVPILVIALLWFLSRKSLSRYTDVEDPGDQPPSHEAQSVLLDPNLWSAGERTRRLQRLHVTAGLSTVVLFSGAHMARVVTSSAAPYIATTACALLLLIFAALLLLVSHQTDLENAIDPGVSSGAFSRSLRGMEVFGKRVGDRIRASSPKVDLLLLSFAVVVLGGHLAVLAVYNGTVDQSQDFFGHNMWFIAVFVLLTVLHLCVFVGGRMHSLLAVLFVAGVVLGALFLGWLKTQQKLQDGGTLTATGFGVFGFWAVLTSWHFGRCRTDTKDKAWRGAGASVLLAAAAWTGLLFTSSVVVATADYLNGSEHSVADLVTGVAPDKNEKSAPTTLDLDPGTRHAYVATGDVKVENAHLHRNEDAEIVVTSGAIAVDGLSVYVPAGEARTAGFTPLRGTTIVKGASLEGDPRLLVSSSLDISDESVTVEDSCFSRSASTRCTAENGTFQTAGLQQVPQKALVVEPRVGGSVVLKALKPPQQPLVVPQVLIWTPMAQLVWILLVALGILICSLVYRKKVWPHIGQLLPLEEGNRTPGPDNDIPMRDRPACIRARRRAAFAHRAETLLDVVGAITAVIALALIVLASTGGPPWQWSKTEWTRDLATLSMYVMVGISAGLIMLGSQIRRSEKARKAVGIIWDLTTFWPRAAHPLAPPCYAERVIPELHTRLLWALGDSPREETEEPNVVILSGHSQGSLIAIAMASRLSTTILKRVRVITYGSQIRALYGRVFPRVFGPSEIGYEATDGTASLVDAFPDVPRDSIFEVFDPPDPLDESFRGRLRAEGGEWFNLFRRSDPIGWRVFSDVDSSLDIAVPEVPREAFGDPGPTVMTHGGYQHTLAYRTRIHAWTGESLVTDPTGTTDVPPIDGGAP